MSRQSEQLARPKSAKPLRLALLGDSRVGKSTFIQSLTTKNFIETYYPTLKATPILLEWLVYNEDAKLILNEYCGIKDYFPILESDKVSLSPKIISSINTNSVNASSKAHHRSSSSKQMKKIKKNLIYNIVFRDDSESAAINADSAYDISPILLELIDTPPFNPTQIVPFLEASLDIKLPADILRNLANEPRRDHSAKPLIVASGAHDLNGNIDGYFFVYSCLPSLNPPDYNDDATTETKNPLNLLIEMKLILDDAWKEYTKYKKGWEIGGEGDIYSFVYSVKSLWKKQSLVSHQDVDSDDYYKPPILIVCTHCNSELKSPKLIKDGRDLAKSWNCGFIEMDNLNQGDVDLLTSLLVRDIVEQNYTK